MCFSATASFATGIALTGVGVATLEQTKTKREIPLALFPLLFGVQQLIEGFVWLSLTRGSYALNTISTCSYTFFSHIFWPMFVPFAVALVEANPGRKRILRGFQVAGMAIGLYTLYAFFQSPVTSSIINHSIVYEVDLFHKVLITGFYVTIVCGSFFVASDRLLNVFGALLLVGFLTAYYFYTLAFVSVWCFFAAILSIVVYLYLKNRS